MSPCMLKKASTLTPMMTRKASHSATFWRASEGGMDCSNMGYRLGQDLAQHRQELAAIERLLHKIGNPGAHREQGEISGTGHHDDGKPDPHLRECALDRETV